MSGHLSIRLSGSLIVLAVVLAGCSGASAPPSAAPTATPTPATTATPTPTPSPTPLDLGAALLADVVRPKFAATFEVSGQYALAPGGGTAQIEVTIDVSGSNMHAVSTFTKQGEAPLAQEELGVHGTVYLRTGAGPWVRNDASQSLPIPSFASAFASVTKTTNLGPTTCAGATYQQVRADDLNLDTFLASLGMVDPGAIGATGTADFCVLTDGTLAGFDIDWTGSPSREDPSARVHQILSAIVSGTPAGPIETPTTWWQRASYTAPAFSGIYPGDWTPESGPNTEDMSNECFLASDDPDYICVIQGPASGMSATQAQNYWRDGMKAKTGTSPTLDEKITLEGLATHLWTFRFSDSEGSWIVHLTAVLKGSRVTCIYSNSGDTDEGAIRQRFIDFLSEFHPAA
jgi:hypothetical protein